MKALSNVLLMVLLIISFVISVHAQEELYKELSNKFIMLYQQGRYSEAENVAKEALTVAEKAFEPNHPYIGTSLNNLALLYYSQGKYALAESIFKQALVICETVFGKNNLHVGTLLDNMASN